MKTILKAVVVALLFIVGMGLNNEVASAEYETVNQYHKIPNGQYMFLGMHTTTYVYVGSVDEIVEIHDGFDAKGKPKYKEIHRKGDVYTRNGTVRLAQGSPIQLISEEEHYHDSALYKETFWRVQDVISGKEYMLKKIGTKMEKTVEQQAFLGGYRLNLTYFNHQMYTTEETQAYTGVNVGNGTYSFTGHRQVTVPKYSRFLYQGVFVAQGKYYVMAASITEEKVVYIPATALQGGIPPIETGGGIIDDGKEDTQPTYTTIEYGQSILVKENFAVVYGGKNRKELLKPTAIIPDRVYTYKRRHTVGSKEVMQLTDNITNKSVYMYADKLLKGSFDLLTEKVDQTAYEQAYKGTVETKSRTTYYYKTATSSAVSGKLKTTAGKPFKITGSKVVGSRVYMQGDLQLTSNTSAKGVYILPSALTQADISVIYISGMTLPYKYVQVPKGLTGYTSVRNSKGKTVESGQTLVTSNTVTYTIRTTKVVNGTSYLGLRKPNDTKTYYVKLSGSKITLKSTNQ